MTLETVRAAQDPGQRQTVGAEARARGTAPVVLVAPHGVAPLEAAQSFLDPDPAVQAQLAAHVAEWHDAGSLEVLQAAAVAAQATAVHNTLPRGVLDLNRGWRGREEAQESLFGKGAVDRWVGEHLISGAAQQLEARYRAAMQVIRSASTGKRGMVEVHSYGDLGSTYDKLAGGRPVRRAEASLVDAAPWRTARPVGLARLIPGDLRALPWALHRGIGDALAEAGVQLGPHPYPSQAPWTVSARFLAERWFLWVAEQGLVPVAAAQRLADLAWLDEQDSSIDRACDGDEDGPLRGVHDLAPRIHEWSHRPGELAARFVRDTGIFATTLELRLDLIGQAPAVGKAVGGALAAFLAQ